MSKKREQGYTMIIVICLMFLFMALALSMLFSSAQLLARAQQAAAQKQSRASAMSFAEWMDEQLKHAPSDEISGVLTKSIKERIESGGWPDYSGDLGHGAEVAILTFTPKAQSATNMLPKGLGELEIKMYWEKEEGDLEPDKSQIDLVVTVKASVKGEQYSVTTRYYNNLSGMGDAESWDGTWYVGGRE